MKLPISIRSKKGFIVSQPCEGTISIIDPENKENIIDIEFPYGIMTHRFKDCNHDSPPDLEVSLDIDEYIFNRYRP